MILQTIDSGPKASPLVANEDLAEKLETVSELLLAQGANRFRAEAYHRAAATIREMAKPLWQIYQADGILGLENVPGVGRTISRALQQLIRGGHWPLLERLQGNDIVEQAFASVPSIGAKLAKRIHDELGVETLVELQAAAWDGRLERIGGFGEKRLRAVRESLAARGRVGRPPSQGRLFEEKGDLSYEIEVAEILDVDDEYRFKAATNGLPRITPRQMNPRQEAWLPILHTQRDQGRDQGRDQRHYTALFSNTEHAHAMGTTHDWVIVYLEDHDKRGQSGRWTVISSQFGKLRGKRIVRGREHECAAYYQKREF